jgi:hypothetical protein
MLLVYGERALVDYDFQKLHLLFRLVQIFFAGKVEVMILIYSRKNL